MLTQLLNIKWTVTEIMLVILVILGLIIFYKFLNFILGRFINYKESKKPVEKKSMIEINNI